MCLASDMSMQIERDPIAIAGLLAPTQDLGSSWCSQGLRVILQDAVAKAASQQCVLALLARCTAGHSTSGPAGDAGQQRPGAGGAPDADAGPGRGGRRSLAALCARCGVDFAAGVISERARRGGLPDEAGFASGV